MRPWFGAKASIRYSLAREHVAGSQRDELVRIGEPPEHAAQVAEQLGEPGRPVDRDRQLAPAERERLQHPGQPEEVVGVEVRQEDLAELDEPDGRAEHLPLRALAQSNSRRSPPAADEQRARRALRRRHRAGRAEEDEVEIHAARLYERRLKSHGRRPISQVVRTMPGIGLFARERSLTLLWAFLLASALILAAGAAALALVMTGALREQARLGRADLADPVRERRPAARSSSGTAASS